jgi:glycosyltransferase involved in cell wall biosynthesis
LKLLITTTYWRKSDGGGIKTYLVNLVQELERMGLDVDVIFEHGEDPDNYKIVEEELNAPFPLKILRAYLALKRLRPEVIHSHGGLYYYLIAGYFYKIIHGTTLVYTFHTEPSPDSQISPLRRFFLQNLLTRCDCVTFVSKALKAKIEDLWGLRFSKYTITYAGVNSEEVSELSRENFLKTFKIDKNSTILLALGLTAMSYKAEGLKILIKAIREVRSKYPNVILVATREGRYIPELKDFAKKEGLEGAVVFTGDVENSYVPLAVCDIYTHISLGEGLPIALLEAMSLGKPIIATAVGGIPEAIEDGFNGFLVGPNENEIAEKICFLIEQKDLADKLGKNARSTAQERFTWKSSAERFIYIYKNKT